MKIQIGNKVHFNIVQLVVFVLGVLLILGMIAYLSYQVVKKEGKPPQLHVQAVYQPELDGYTYRVRVKNTGGETATNAHIKMTLYQDGKTKETTSITIPYVPVQAEQIAWVVFTRNRKATDSLVVSSINYLKP